MRQRATRGCKNVRSETVRIEPRKTLGVGEGTVGKVCKGFAEIGSGGRPPDYSGNDSVRRRRENMETEDPEKRVKRARRIGGFVPRGVAHGPVKARFNRREKFNRKVKQREGDSGLEPPRRKTASKRQEFREDIAKAIDTCVVYLWNVHGIDYYGGRETNPHDYIEIAEGERETKYSLPNRYRLALSGGEHAVPADAPIEPIEATKSQQNGQSA